MTAFHGGNQRGAYRFGTFRLIAASGILEHRGVRIPLTPKTFTTLLVLIQSAGEVVDKGRLMAEVWPGVYVVESGLARNISVLRKTLQDLEPGVDFIETVPRRGYRFIAPVESEADPPTKPDASGSVLGQEPYEDTPAAAVHEGPRAVPNRAFWIAWYTAAAVLLVAGTWHSSLRPVEVAGAGPALEDYRLASHLMRQATLDQARKSVDLLERSVRLYPEVALTHAGLANALLTEVELGADQPHSKLVKARLAAARAVELDPGLEQAQIVFGLAVFLADWDWARAESELRRAIALNPVSAAAHQTYAHFLVKTGRIDEALAAIGRAAELDPVSPMIGAQRAHIHYCARRFDEAVRLAEAVLDRQPRFTVAQRTLALSLAHLGSYGRALLELERAGRRGQIEPDRAWILAQTGDREAAERIAATLPPSRAILLRAALGQAQLALEGLEQLTAERSSEALNLMADPRIEPLRAHPRYRQLRRRAGL